MYGAGLRVSEAVKLRPADLDLSVGVGWVRRGKGNKDRPFIVPECLKEQLAERGQSNFVFVGNKGMHLSVRSVQEVLNRAALRAGIGKHVHPHTLRHSFATHLIESGQDITSVQALLGHCEARTTMVYLHAAKPRLLSVRSPLDNL
jgi:integrase/recombinase XerC